MSSHRHFLAAILFLLASYECCCEDSYLRLCEGQTRKVTCQNNSIINVISATYGYNGSNVVARRECDDWWNKNSLFRDPDNTDCHHPESTTILTDGCNGLSECTVTANNRIFGDPCRGTTKYFELYYNCKQDEGENRMPTETPNMSGEDGHDRRMDGGNHNMKDDPVKDVSQGTGEQNSNSDEKDDDDDDDDDDKDDNYDKDGKGLSPVAVVAIAAGIPVGLIILIVILACSLICFLQSKRRKKSRISGDRNMSVNQYTSQGLTTTVSTKTEESEMVYNTAYQSMDQEIDASRNNYQNSSGTEFTNDNVRTDHEETVYNEAYQSVKKVVC